VPYLRWSTSRRRGTWPGQRPSAEQGGNVHVGLGMRRHRLRNRGNGKQAPLFQLFKPPWAVALSAGSPRARGSAGFAITSRSARGVHRERYCWSERDSGCERARVSPDGAITLRIAVLATLGQGFLRRFGVTPPATGCSNATNRKRRFTIGTHTNSFWRTLVQSHFATRQPSSSRADLPRRVRWAAQFVDKPRKRR
jgi:hypothetical protein